MTIKNKFPNKLVKENISNIFVCMKYNILFNEMKMPANGSLCVQHIYEYICLQLQFRSKYIQIHVYFKENKIQAEVYGV